MTAVKICVRCKQLKPVTDFPRSRLLKSGITLHKHECVECKPPRQHTPKVQRAPAVELSNVLTQWVRDGHSDS